MVYITGDLHGDLARLSAPDMRQVKKGDTLIVCGDFGFRRPLCRTREHGPFAPSVP